MPQVQVAQVTHAQPLESAWPVGHRQVDLAQLDRLLQVTLAKPTLQQTVHGSREEHASKLRAAELAPAPWNRTLDPLGHGES
jgi:hypothetical protein